MNRRRFLTSAAAAALGVGLFYLAGLWVTFDALWFARDFDVRLFFLAMGAVWGGGGVVIRLVYASGEDFRGKSVRT